MSDDLMKLINVEMAKAIDKAFGEVGDSMSEPSEPLHVTQIGAVFPVSTDVLMDNGVIPDTRPPRTPPTRRERLHWWRQQNLTVRAVRSRLADWIDPDDRGEDYE